MEFLLVSWREGVDAAGNPRPSAMARLARFNRKLLNHWQSPCPNSIFLSRNRCLVIQGSQLKTEENMCQMLVADCLEKVFAFSSLPVGPGLYFE